jgi:hypothetical protein
LNNQDEHEQSGHLSAVYSKNLKQWPEEQKSNRVSAEDFEIYLLKK